VCSIFPDFNFTDLLNRANIYYFRFRVDRNEVSFKVEPNSLGLNASEVANKIGKCPVIYFHANLILN
jgi:hypothetical protein